MTRRRFLAACAAALLPAVPARAASVKPPRRLGVDYPLYRTEAELAALRNMPRPSRAEHLRLLKELIAEMDKPILAGLGVVQS